MLVQGLLIGLLATICGGTFIEYLVWIIRNPIIEGALTGLILGDWMTGATIGATIQLIYMGQITVGGVSSFDKCYVTLGTIGLLASNALMTVNVAFVHMADRYIETGETKRLWIYNWLLPQLVSALFYGVPAFICVYFGADVFENLMSSLPTQVNNALNVVGSVLPALGIGMMFKAVYKKKFVAFAIIGFVLIAYLGLDIIACTLVGVAAAILYWSLGLDKLTEGENSNE